VSQLLNEVTITSEDFTINVIVILMIVLYIVGLAESQMNIIYCYNYKIF